jgi:hypothetical protein
MNTSQIQRSQTPSWIASSPTPKGSNSRDPHYGTRNQKKTCNFVKFLETPPKVVTYGPELVVTYGRKNQRNRSWTVAVCRNALKPTVNKTTPCQLTAGPSRGMPAARTP